MERTYTVLYETVRFKTQLDIEFLQQIQLQVYVYVKYVKTVFYISDSNKYPR